jgi:tetratricopeptide (TPR) repeat protein
VSKAGDQVSHLLFKQVAGGYVFRAPNPRVFGPTDHYLVNESQRDEILAIMTPRRPVVLLVVWIGGFLLALGAGIVSMFAYVADYPVTVFLVLTAAMLMVAVLALHLSISRKLRRLRPILAGVPQTDQRITIAEIRQALNQKQSYQQLRRAAILNAVTCVISAASAALMLYLRKPHVSFLSDPLWVMFGFNTVLFGFSSVSSYLGALQKREHADGTESAVDPIFNKTSQYLISACAVALLVFLAASAWVGVKREFSDQSEGLRYAAKGEHDSAIASFSKTITTEPNNSDAYLGRAKSYDAKGDHDHAIADYTKAIEIEPSDAVIYRKRGDVYRVKGALDNAVTDYSKAIELDPKGAFAYYLRGLSHAANKNSDRAIADFTKAIEFNPKDAYSYISRARSFEARGDRDRAIADFSRAIEINPNYASAYYSRGLFNAANKNNDGAIADFTKAIEIDPKNAYPYVSRAQRFEAKGDYDHATADFSKAIEINPKYYYAYILRGDSLAARGEHDRAIGDFTKAIEIEPKNTAAYRSRASAYTVTGARSLAIADYRTILTLPAVTNADRQGQGYARQRIDQLTSATPAPAGSSTVAPALTPR